jgi:hypothetical protein
VTLKLVHDANVVPLDTPNYGDVPGCLRRLAEEIEADTHGDIFRAVMVLQTDCGIAISRLGECCTAYELMGLFEAAKLRVFADDAIPDE